MKRLNATDSKKLLDEGWTYVDVRTPAEFAAGRPSGSTNVPLAADFLQVMQAKFKPDHKLVIGCQVGGRSMRAAAALEQSGFTQVVDNAGGFEEWAAKKLPTER